MLYCKYKSQVGIILSKSQSCVTDIIYVFYCTLAVQYFSSQQEILLSISLFCHTPTVPFICVLDKWGKSTVYRCNEYTWEIFFPVSFQYHLQWQLLLMSLWLQLHQQGTDVSCAVFCCSVLFAGWKITLKKAHAKKISLN